MKYPTRAQLAMQAVEARLAIRREHQQAAIRRLEAVTKCLNPVCGSTALYDLDTVTRRCFMCGRAVYLCNLIRVDVMDGR